MTLIRQMRSHSSSGTSGLPGMLPNPAFEQDRSICPYRFLASPARWTMSLSRPTSACTAGRRFPTRPRRPHRLQCPRPRRRARPPPRSADKARGRCHLLRRSQRPLAL
jgi:hypothetical protein